MTGKPSLSISASKLPLPIRERRFERRPDPRNRWWRHQDDGGAGRQEGPGPSHRPWRRRQCHGQSGLAQRARKAHGAVPQRSETDRGRGSLACLRRGSPSLRDYWKRRSDKPSPMRGQKSSTTSMQRTLARWLENPASFCSREPDPWLGPGTPTENLPEPAAGATLSAMRGAATGLDDWRSTW
jgi:hypothetical protein